MATGKLLVGAIDFGTTYSGWAYSLKHDFMLDPTKGYVKQWHSGESLVTEKTPTCLLVRPDGKTLKAFGYDAENKYRELTDEGLHKDYFYFRRFKMLLNKKLGEKLDRSMGIEDEMGKSLPAMQVFSMSIKYLFDDMKEVVLSKLLGTFDAKDFHIVLTVPAIWTDSAKQFMRLAATQAGISSENLTIALEPEAASIFCRHLSMETTVDKRSVSISKMSVGTRYMIIDAGGGTIDIAVHEVVSKESVKEITSASGGGWGGIVVDKAFEDFLIDVVGNQVYETFKTSEAEDWLNIWRDFEAKKRNIKPDSVARVNIRFPLSFARICKTLTQTELSEAISLSKYKGKVELDGDKLKFTANLFKTFFDDSIRTTVEHVKSLYRHEQVRKIKAILMVGGYSESPMLQQAIKNEFQEVEVIIPIGASSTIVRGALVYGHAELSIIERTLKYTYGMSCAMTFREGVDPERLKFNTDCGYRCNRFDAFVEKGQAVKCKEVQASRTYTTIFKNQKTMTLHVFATELKDLEYPSEGGIEIGKITIELQNPDETTDRAVATSMTFGGTEIEVKGVDLKTGIEMRAYMDFLG